MKINFKISRDDYIAFNMAHVKSSRSTKSLIIAIRLLVPALLFFYALYIGKITDPLYMGVFVIVSVPWAILSPRIIWINMVKQINKILDEGQVGDLFSQRSLDFNEDHILESTDQTTSTYMWSAIVDVRETERALYLYTNEVQAIILPKSEIKSMDKIKKLIKEHTKFKDI